MRTHCIAQETPLSALWRLKWKGSPKNRGSMYMQGWFTLLYSRNPHNIVKQLYSSKKKKNFENGDHSWCWTCHLSSLSFGIQMFPSSVVAYFQAISTGIASQHLSSPFYSFNHGEKEPSQTVRTGRDSVQFSKLKKKTFFLFSSLLFLSSFLLSLLLWTGMETEVYRN